ncbi:MAG: hypothetical protein G8345_08570 [Magnetococcales bacterium]|nr:cache domain-containing protein [Magnetococcales bacterium]NGZ26928.1 hypothetical protein [Magnetococcales bacterium]
MNRKLLWILLGIWSLQGQWGGAAPMNDRNAAAERAVNQLETMQFRLNMFHYEAESSLRSSLELPVFAEYFSLEDSKTNRYDEMGVLQTTQRQNLLRKRMEEWALILNKRFPINEACLVDRHGQEHMRTADGKVETHSHFSSDEHGSPFFKATFERNKGEVYQSTPYMSPDSYRWVVSFTSPVVLESGEKPAFLHFELPLAFYQVLLTTKSTSFSTSEMRDPDDDEEGRYFILTKELKVIADSKQTIDLELKAERHPEKNAQLPDYLPPERLDDYLPEVTAIHKDSQFLQGVKDAVEQGKGMVSLTIDGVEYVMAFLPVPNRPWIMFHLDPVVHKGFWEKR